MGQEGHIYCLMRLQSQEIFEDGLIETAVYTRVTFALS